MFHSVVLIPSWKSKKIGKICADFKLLWFNLSQQPCPTPTHSSPSQDGERIRRINMRTCGLRSRDTLGGKTKAVHKKTKEFIHHFSWAGRCLTVPRRAGLYSAKWLLEKTNSTTVNIPQLYIRNMMPYGMDILQLGYPYHMGSAVQAVWPPIFLCTPSLLGVVWGKEQKRPRLWVSTAQQQLKHPCVVSLISIIKHSPILAAMKGINFQTKTSTHIS